MRPARELEAMVTAAIAMSGGEAPTDLLAVDDAEAAWLAARLKGRHGVKPIGILRGTPADLIPAMDRARGPVFEEIA